MSNPLPSNDELKLCLTLVHKKMALCINIQIFYAILKGFHVSVSDPLPLNDELKIGLTLVHKNWTYINNQIFYAMSNLQPQKYA